MFSFSNLPDVSLLPKPTQPAARRYLDAADRLARHTADHAFAMSADAVNEAALADATLMRDAITAGADVAAVGAPNEAARLSQVRAHAAAAALCTTDAYEAGVALAAVLYEHRDAVIEAAAKHRAAPAKAYAAAVERVLELRREYGLAIEYGVWAHGINDSSDIPNYGADPTPPLEWETVHINENALAAALRADAQRHARADQAEAERARRVAEDARAEAANRALGDAIRADLEAADRRYAGLDA